MPRPLTRAQSLENAAFLRALRRTGNVREAARMVGLAYGTVQYRRGRHPGFAQGWDVAVAFASWRLQAGGGTHGPSAVETDSTTAHRTKGGEPVVVRLRSGKLQVRRAQPGKLTRQCEQAFLLALSATANVALSAAAAGAAERAFYRRRADNPAFAREMRLALEQGYERIEAALIASREPASHADSAWRHNDPPAIPPMTADQALQLLYLHQKEARLLAEPAHLKRRRGEGREAHLYRLATMARANEERRDEEDRVAQAARDEEAAYDEEVCQHEPPPIVLPDLAQVAWSKADPTKLPHHPEVAGFGGWRIEDLSEEQQALAARRRAEARGRGRG